MALADEIIAGHLPLGPDEWVSDKVECAKGIIEALKAAGLTVVRAEPPKWMNSEAKAHWRMVISSGDET